MARGGPALFDGLLLAGGVLLALLLAGPILMLGLHLPLNYNEGWNAYFAVRAMDPSAGPLYPPAGSLVFNNYPPLSFYLVGAVGRWLTGDMILAGRAVALAGLIGSGVALGIAVGGQAGRAARLLLVLFACTFFRDYVAMDDPQWLGHALMLGGLAVLLRAGTGGRAIAAAAALILAGGFVKHTLVALPIAAAAYVCWRDRRAGLWFVLLLVAGIGAGLGLLVLAHGPVALADILQHRRLWQPGGLAKGAGRLLPFLPAAVLAAVALWPRRAQPKVACAMLFLAVAAATGIAQRAGAGVAVNAQFEAMIAVCLALGLAVQGPAQTGGARWSGGRAPAVIWALAAAPILLVLPKRLPHAWDDLIGRRSRAAAWQPVIARLAAAQGPVACETLALCYWAGKPFTVDFFNLTQSLRARAIPHDAGARRPGPDLPDFALIEDDPASPIHEGGADPLMAALRRGHQRVATGPGHAELLGRGGG